MTNAKPEPDPASAEVLIDKLENYYDFECSGGRLGLCVDWERLKAHVATLTEQWTSANARFCDQHRGIYRTSGCVVCGLMAAAVELRESEAKAATLTEQRDRLAERAETAEARIATLDAHIAALNSTLSRSRSRLEALEADLQVNATMLARQCDLAREAEQQLAALESEHRRALDQMDTETARANGLGEVNQQLGAKLRALEAALERAVETIRTWHGMGMPATVRYAEHVAWALYQESPEMKAITAALAAVRAPEPPQEPRR